MDDIVMHSVTVSNWYLYTHGVVYIPASLYCIVWFAVVDVLLFFIFLCCRYMLYSVYFIFYSCTLLLQSVYLWNFNINM